MSVAQFSENHERVPLEPVNLLEHFDLETHKRIGLDWSRMVDPEGGGSLADLRIAAGHFALDHSEGGTRSTKTLDGLQDAVWDVLTDMRGAADRLRTNAQRATDMHPAIQAYAEQHPEALQDGAGMYGARWSILRETAFVLPWTTLSLVVPNSDHVEPDQSYRRIGGLTKRITQFSLPLAEDLMDAHLAVDRLPVRGYTQPLL